MTRRGHAGAQPVQTPLVGLVRMGRTQRPARFYSRRAAIFGGQQKRKRMTDTRTAPGFGGQMQTPDGHHGWGRRQVCDDCWRMPVTQRFFHRPQRIVTFMCCHEKQVTGIDQVCDTVGAQRVRASCLRDPDNRPLKARGEGQRQSAPRRAAEFVNTPQPQRNLVAPKGDLGVSAVWAS